MNTFNSAPFFRILPAFCLGIAAAFYQWIDFTVATIIFFASVLFLIIIFNQKKISYRVRLFPGILFQFLFLIFGYYLTEIKDDRHLENYFTNQNSPDYYIAELIDKPHGKGGKFRVPVCIKSIYDNNKLISASGKCFLYFKDDIQASQLETGDKILFSGKPVLIPAPQNPGQFDFRLYSSVRRIYYCFYLKKNSWTKESGGDPYSLKIISSKLRNNFLDVYKKAGISGQEYAVLSALVLGYDDEIDSDIMNAFSASGTLHILSVSGMHVGIIFTAISSLLIFMERKKALQVPRLIILLIVLWFYAFLTGLSPSVIRSCMMFSFIIIGQTFNRTSSIYNSLSVSALCIFILFDPLMFFDVGLQLSFIAVGGISFLYSKIYKIISFEKYVLDKSWSLIAVSVAAQIATFPISIFYFHQFPNYFILANLIIIPLSTVGIFSGIFLLFLQPLQFIFDLLCVITKNIIHLLNQSAIIFRELPGAVWDKIYFSFMDIIIIYFILFTLIFFIEKKSVNLLFSTFFLLIILFSNLVLKSFQNCNEKSLIVFSNTNSFCCQFTIGSRSWLFYHELDSLKALICSDQFLLSKNISTAYRTLVSLENKMNISLPENIYINEKYLVINNFLIIDSPDSQLLQKQLFSLQPKIIYFQKLPYDFKGIKNFKKILVNKNYKSFSEIDKRKIINLQEGSYYLRL